MVATTLYQKRTFILKNRAINDNLEQQAQALFKSWFVDNVDPKWLEIPLSDIADFYGGYSYHR